MSNTAGRTAEDHVPDSPKDRSPTIRYYGSVTTIESEREPVRPEELEQYRESVDRILSAAAGAR